MIRDEKNSEFPDYDERLLFETLIADLSSKFVNLPADEVDDDIMDAERRICGLLDLDILALWQWSDKAAGAFTLTHFYSAQEGPQPDMPLHEDDYPWFWQQTKAGRIVAIPSQDDLPPEASHDRQTCLQFGIKSTLTIPLAVGGQPTFGVFCLNTTRSEREWPDAVVNRLKLVAQIFANALARKHAEEASRVSEARLEATAELAGLGNYEVDFPEPSYFVDERFHQICGIDAGRHPGLGAVEFWMEHLHPEDLHQVLAERQKLHDGRIERLSIEYRYLHPTQGLKWIHHLAMVSARDATGKSIHSYGAIRDITSKKRAEDEMRNLSRRLIQAHEEERSRLARDLHDDVSQRLARLAIDAGQVEQAFRHHAQAETLRSLREGLVSLSEDIHALSYRLHPSILEDLGLAEALKAECERFSRLRSIPTEVTVRKMPANLPPETALCLFRVVQEALQNVARHAHAHRVEVSVRPHAGGLQLAVLDDGIGFDPASPRDHPSLGLASMRERVMLLGGEIDIESAPDQGTTILISIPRTSVEGGDLPTKTD